MLENLFKNCIIMQKFCLLLQIKLINKNLFTKIALTKNFKTFIIHIAVLKILKLGKIII